MAEASSIPNGWEVVPGEDDSAQMYPGDLILRPIGGGTARMIYSPTREHPPFNFSTIKSSGVPTSISPRAPRKTTK